jgi:hypothetical protein
LRGSCNVKFLVFIAAARSSSLLLLLLLLLLHHHHKPYPFCSHPEVFRAIWSNNSSRPLLAFLPLLEQTSPPLPI